ncbi:MAG TPA: NADAR family protein [Blastocatellia bacterium]|nr:NADAR family protein [Blastocatellia bacterium]
MEPIKFYKTNDPFGCFSNFAAYPITLKGKVWPTTEHYFQAQKFPNSEHEENIRLCESPMIAARMGRDRSKPLRKDWEIVKDDIMREGLRAKFNQHQDLQKILLETGDAEIIEHTTNDKYWGDGGDGSGKNMLGRLLMELRSELMTEMKKL